MDLPILYKKTSTGAIQQWEVSSGRTGYTVSFGQVDGKIQSTYVEVPSGKNLGKANATTQEQQTYLEAKYKWEKQLKKGYVENIDQAKAGNIDPEYIKGGINPMLAASKVWGTDLKHTAKIKFPAYVQPKLDGVRCIAIIKNGAQNYATHNRPSVSSFTGA